MCRCLGIRSTCIKAPDAYAYLIIVTDLFSRRVVCIFSAVYTLPAGRWIDAWLSNWGCRIAGTLHGNIVQVSENKVLIHSEQETQLINRDCALFLLEHNLKHLMSRRRCCYANTVAESLFNLLKRGEGDGAEPAISTKKRE
jgi:transposase InsO family protein